MSHCYEHDIDHFICPSMVDAHMERAMDAAAWTSRFGEYMVVTAKVPSPISTTFVSRHVQLTANPPCGSNVDGGTPLSFGRQKRALDPYRPPAASHDSPSNCSWVTALVREDHLCDEMSSTAHDKGHLRL